MIDLNFIKKNPNTIDNSLKLRNKEPISEKIITLDKENKEIKQKINNLRQKHNIISKNASIKKNITKDIKNEASDIKSKILILKKKTETYSEKIKEILTNTPNTLSKKVTKNNTIVKEWGVKTNIKNPKEHFKIKEISKYMDFETAANISGSKFVILLGELAKLERSLGNFMLNTHIEESKYTEVSPPLLVNSKSMFGTGQLPKFSKDCFKTNNDKWLIPTSEVPLTNLVREKIFTRITIAAKILCIHSLLSIRSRVSWKKQ